MEKTVGLSSESYNEFLRCLSVLREVCNDVDIRGGFIRQRSNDNGSIFEMDVNSLVEDINMPLSNLSENLELLKMFSDEEVHITFDEHSVSFVDQYSILKFDCPALEFLDNRFMNEDELKNIFTLDDEKIVVDYEIPTPVTDRIRIVSKGFNVTTVQINFEGETISLSTRNQAKDKYARFIGGVDARVVIESGSSNLVVTPFVIDHTSDILFKMYESSKEGIFINKFSTDIEDVPVAVYTRSSLIQEEE